MLNFTVQFRNVTLQFRFGFGLFLQLFAQVVILVFVVLQLGANALTFLKRSKSQELTAQNGPFRRNTYPGFFVGSPSGFFQLALELILQAVQVIQLRLSLFQLTTQIAVLVVKTAFGAHEVV